jgi:benzodiazapine receptor
MKAADTAKLVLCLFACLSAGLFGSIFTHDLSGWYRNLNKPFFTPPNWIFGPVWTALYILMALSAFLIWKRGLENRPVKIAFGFFIAQLVLNALWTPLFFGLKSPLIAFLEILILWTFILVTIVRFIKLSLPAAVMLVPYILWTSYAAVLNAVIYLLN